MGVKDSLAAIARNPSMGGILNRTPIARSVVTRVVGGDSVVQALAVAGELADRGMWVALERAAYAVSDGECADLLLADYLQLVEGLSGAGLGGVSEIAAFAEWLDPPNAPGGRLVALAEAATRVGIELTLGMGRAASVDPTLEVVAGLQGRGLLVSPTLQANLRRTESDCRDFAGSRARLVKGGFRESSMIAHTLPAEIDKAFVRCSKVLLASDGEPSFATHDPRLIKIVEDVALRYGRPEQTYEFAFYMGRLQAEQNRLCDDGHRVRVYVPYGPDWFGRLVGGLAEQPASIASAVRSLLPGLPTRSAADDGKEQ